MAKRKSKSKKRRSKFRPLSLLVLLIAAAAGFAGYSNRDRLPDISRLESIHWEDLANWKDYLPKETSISKSLSVDASGPVDAFKPVGGFPKSEKEGVVTLLNTGYAVGYDTLLEDPLWSVYYCGPEKKYEVKSRAGIDFSEDDRLPTRSRLDSDDFDRPRGASPTYDRGHMSPNYAIASRYGDVAQKETFLLSNITPQRSSLNQQTWRFLESEIANVYAPEMDGVWVTVGPIFDKTDPDRVRYNGKAAMPVAFYCIVLDRDEEDGSLNALAVELNQSVSGAHAMREYETTIRQIEKDTGLDFFSALPDEIENKLETTPAGSEWHVNAVLSGK